MKKIILKFILLSVFAFSDVLYIKKNRCILNDYYFKDSRFHYDYSSTGYHASTSTFNASHLEYGYEYVNNQCKKIQVLKDTNMTYQDYKFMIALTGLLIGFSIFILLIILFVGVL